MVGPIVIQDVSAIGMVGLTEFVLAGTLITSTEIGSLEIGGIRILAAAVAGTIITSSIIIHGAIGGVVPLGAYLERGSSGQLRQPFGHNRFTTTTARAEM